MAFKHIAGLILLVVPALSTANPEGFSTSPLLQGTKIVAGPNKDEFFILAQNDTMEQVKPPMSQKTSPTESANKVVPSQAVSSNQSSNKMVAKLTKHPAEHRPKQAVKQHAKQTTPPHWVPRLKKALADLKVSPKAPSVSTTIALNQQKTKKVVMVHKKKPIRKVKLAQKKQDKKKSEIMTFHVTAYTPEYGVRNKKPATSPMQKRAVAKAIPLNDEKEQIMAFNAD